MKETRFINIIKNRKGIRDKLEKILFFFVAFSCAKISLIKKIAPNIVKIVEVTIEKLSKSLLTSKPGKKMNEIIPGRLKIQHIFQIEFVLLLQGIPPYLFTKDLYKFYLLTKLLMTYLFILLNYNLRMVEYDY